MRHFDNLRDVEQVSAAVSDDAPPIDSECRQVALELQTRWGRLRYWLWEHHLMSWPALERSLAKIGETSLRPKRTRQRFS